VRRQQRGRRSRPRSDATDPVACLREKPAAEIAAARRLDFTTGGFAWGHSVDGHFLPAPIGTLVGQRRHNHVPFIVGVTAHEMTTLWRTGFPDVPIPSSQASFDSAIRAVYGPTHADAIIAAYPLTSYSSPAIAAVAATTDSHFICPARAFARAFAASQSEPVRRFHFSQILTNGPARALGAGHGLDLLFVFRPAPVSWLNLTAEEAGLSDSMIGYFTRFAATGDPNAPSAVAWQPYDVTRDTYLDFGTPVRSGERLREAQCNFWQSL
jgi:para-nitrobenzyl esterase